MKPKTFVIIGSVMWVAFYTFLFSSMFYPSLIGPLSGRDIWIITQCYNSLMALVFLTAIILKIIKTMKLRSERPDSAINQTQDENKLTIMWAKIFGIIGIVMSAFAVYYLIYALFHPERATPWTHETTWIIYKTYLVATAASFLIAIILKAIRTIKNKF